MGVFIVAGLLGLSTGFIGGTVAGFISMLIGNVQNAYLGLTLLAFLLGLIISFPIAGLCTGLVMATQRRVERGSVVGAVIFDGSQLVLSIASITEFWMVVASVVVMAAVLGTFIGAMSAGLSAAASQVSSAQNHATLETET